MNSNMDTDDIKRIKLHAFSKLISTYTSKFLKDDLKQYGKKLLRILLFVLPIMAIINLALNLTHTQEVTTSLQSKSQFVQRQLNDLNAQVSDLAKHNTNALDKNDAQKMQQDILDLQKNIATLASSSDLSKITKTLDEVKKNLADIKKNVDTQSGQLPVSALPFEVLSLDVLNGAAYLTISSNHKLSTVKQGDSIGEWTVSEIAQTEKNAVFQNAAGEQVIVHLAK